MGCATDIGGYTDVGRAVCKSIDACTSVKYTLKEGYSHT